MPSLGRKLYLPSSNLGKAHQDAFDALPRLQSKNGSTVIHKAEFHTTSSSQQLPLLLRWRKLVVLVLLNYWTECLDYRVDSVLTKVKNLVGIAVILVVEKDPSQSTSFTTMRDLEVSIGPNLELWVVVVGIVTAKHLHVRAMEMLHVVLVDIARSNVGTSTKLLNTTISLNNGR